ncbi:MAG TPA: hypothetical protein VMD78_01895 [Candidatus Baltobacteraceae bacterium]|nr:hypothetical protein [Candidatus Baltobacteraceae bacterium]
MNRRKMLALLGASPALAASSPSYARTAPKNVAKPVGSLAGNLITALNPAVTPQLAKRIPLAPRLDTLNGKTIYLVDTDWGGMGQNGSILEEMQAWFKDHLPAVKTIIKVKKGNFVTDDPALWKEIADAKGDGVILGVAG